MQKVEWQNEKTVYKCPSEFGDIIIKEQGLIRNLYFQDKKQSSIFLPDPSVLVLSYAQAMMTALLFQPRPKKILLLGLGGGSFFHFMRENFPDCEMEVVELSSKVIDIANQLFKVPVNHPSLKIHNEDARKLVEKLASSNARYDMILVDTFDQWGPVEFMREHEFIENCRSLLTSEGICSFNLWNRKEDAYHQVVSVYERIFNNNILELKLGKVNSNAILHGFQGQINKQKLKNLKEKAVELKENFGVDFVYFHKQLVQQNLSFLKEFKRAIFT